MPFFKNTIRHFFPVFVIYCLWCIVPFAVFEFGLLIPVMGKIPLNILIPMSLAFFICLGSLSIVVFMVYAQPDFQQHPRSYQFSTLFSIILAIGLFLFVRHVGSKSLIVFILVTANLMVLANLIGIWLVSPLKRPAELVLLCMVMSLSDMFSVFGGPTRHIAETVEDYYRRGMTGDVPMGDFLLLKIAVPGMDGLMPVFGVTDWIIVVFFSAAVVRFGMRDNLAGHSLEKMVKEKYLAFYLPVGAAGLYAAVLAAQWVGIFLPALPIISVSFLAYILIRYPDSRKLTRKDWLMMGAFAGIMGGIFGLYYYGISG